MKSPRLITQFALASIGVACLAGCGLQSGASTAPTTGSCITQPNQKSSTPVVVVLKALGEPDTPAVMSGLSKVIAGAEQEKANLILTGITASSASRNEVIDTQLVGAGPNPLLAGDNLQCKSRAIASRFAKLAEQSSGRGLDVLSGLRSVSQDLSGLTPSRVDVVVFSSALQTADTDLADPSVLSNPAASLNKLSREGLGVSLKNLKVYLVGSNSAHGAPVSAQTEAELQSWWKQYVTLEGGTLVAFSSALTEFPLNQSVGGPDYASVSIRRSADTVTATIASDALFETGSATLLAEAATDLSKVLPDLSGVKGTVAITGYTDSEPDSQPGGNAALSRARAYSVAVWLSRQTHLPLSSFAVHGDGAANPAASNATPQGREENRRVTVFFTT